MTEYKDSFWERPKSANALELCKHRWILIVNNLRFSSLNNTIYIWDEDFKSLILPQIILLNSVFNGTEVQGKMGKRVIF